jgi:hypothetical protein
MSGIRSLYPSWPLSVGRGAVHPAIVPRNSISSNQIGVHYCTAPLAESPRRYMDKPPKPVVDPAYNEEWHDKVVQLHENRR